MASTIKSKEYDVVVVGGGNAGLCAAVSAQEFGGSVLVVEKAPKEHRGGNTGFTGFFRFTYSGLEDVQKLVPDLSEEERKTIVMEPYSVDQYYNDIMRRTRGRADPELTEILANYSRPTIDWMDKLGIKNELNYLVMIRYEGKLLWQPGIITMPKGGGEGLVDMLFAAAEEKGVEVAYEAPAMKLLTDSSGRVSGVLVKTTSGLQEITAKRGVILASGGFQSSPEMRGKYMGPGWDIVKVRGTKYNTGEGLTMALEVGAKTTGEWSGAHATQVDAGAPDHDMGDETFRVGYTWGIMVNSEGERFLDEGADFQLYTYAAYGKEVLLQPNAWACQIYDQKVVSLLDRNYDIGTPPIVTNTIEELAEQFEIHPEKLVKTITEFNNAVQEGEFDPGKLDGKRTVGILPPKSNWAQKIDSPPFVAHPVTAGITFTYGGLETNKYAQVLDTLDNPIPGLYATGEIHGFYYHGYAGASGLTKGSVFGRIAGAHVMGHKII